MTSSTPVRPKWSPLAVTNAPKAIFFPEVSTKLFVKEQSVSINKEDYPSKFHIFNSLLGHYVLFLATTPRLIFPDIISNVELTRTA